MLSRVVSSKPTQNMAPWLATSAVVRASGRPSARTSLTLHEGVVMIAVMSGVLTPGIVRTTGLATGLTAAASLPIA